MGGTLQEQNPYQILDVPFDATLNEIEDAYDELYDAHEAQARAGDAGAIQFLQVLNDAHDTLVDARRRYQLDKSLGIVKPQARAATATAERPKQPQPAQQPGRKGSRQQAAQQTNSRPPSQRAVTAPGRPANGKVAPKRGRSTPIAVQQGRNTRTLWLVGLGGLSVLILGGLIAFLVLRGNGNNVNVTGNLAITAEPSQMQLAVPRDNSRGEVLATVNGMPIYEDDWKIRLEKDKSSAISDPLFQGFFNNFQGITGTKALDILSYDSMDKLINLEVIMQQAKKEGVYPTDEQAKGLIDQAKQEDLKNGQNFQDFLKQKSITEDMYNRTVIQNVVYTVMADRYVPKTGTSEEKQNGFMQWICSTRRGYDVRIYHKFPPMENQPCTSGLPTDLPLPGVEESTPPPDVPTQAAPAAPANPRPTATK